MNADVRYLFVPGILAGVERRYSVHFPASTSYSGSWHWMIRAGICCRPMHMGPDPRVSKANTRRAVPEILAMLVYPWHPMLNWSATHD